jgi:hypothetical protein
MGEFVSEMRWERRDGGMFVVLGGGGCSRRHDNTCLIIASLSTGGFPTGVGTSYRDTTAPDARKFYYRSYGPGLQCIMIIAATGIPCSVVSLMCQDLSSRP